MKIKEIANLKPVTLEALNTTELAEYLNDRNVILTGRKVATAFGIHQKQQQPQPQPQPQLGTQAQNPDEDPPTLEEFHALVVEYVSEKVFQQKIDQLTSQDIENAVNDTIKSMDPNDKNEKLNIYYYKIN